MALLPPIIVHAPAGLQRRLLDFFSQNDRSPKLTLMSALGQKRTFAPGQLNGCFAPIADLHPSPMRLVLQR